MKAKLHIIGHLVIKPGHEPDITIDGRDFLMLLAQHFTGISPYTTDVDVLDMGQVEIVINPVESADDE